MKRILGLAALGCMMVSPAWAEQPLYVAYPPTEHKTTSNRIFFIGTASPDAEVTVNGEVIERSPAGHFAPSFSLEMGENIFQLRHEDEEITLKINRISNLPELPEGVGFVEDSLEPKVNLTRMPGELVCFSAIAPPNGRVSVEFAGQNIPLSSRNQALDLPDNFAVLTGNNQPIEVEISKYQGCAEIGKSFPVSQRKNQINLGQPQYKLTLKGETVTQNAPGNITIISPAEFEIAEVTVDEGVARTGPSTTYSRLTPLPKGTKARITGREGDYLRLDYGGWIKADETRILTGKIPPQSFIRSASSRRVGDWTEVYFPLQIPVPVSVKQDNQSLTLTLHNTIAQTDTIRFDDSPLIERMDWEPVLSPMEEQVQAVQYTFHLKTQQQWGYKLRYEGTTLVLSLKHPPQIEDSTESSFLGNFLRPKPLAGMYILIDPGHGSENDLGARGPTGYPEKDVNLVVSYLLQNELIKRGARVYMTRKSEEDLFPRDRVKMINDEEPDLSLSIHYNALPDNGDAMNVKGIGMFWYHPQAHSLAVFLHNYLVEKLDRPSYGVFWNNLALTRPAVTPSILLELGFMINPVEFEWIVNPQEQRKLAVALADGIVEWVETTQ
ncbi:MAG: N-acetylmuramoyl-L-alanine amidase [Cyanobacteria bacterium J06592_8]